MSIQTPPFQPGDTFILRKQTYKVKDVRPDTYRPGEWIVIAWRFIKTTQKYSGNAYQYSASRILANSVEG